MRYLLTLKYKGTNYHGWQVQSNAIAVQTVVQDALEKILHCRPALSGCSRTDSGVHANMYCCHFDFDGDLSRNTLTIGLNMHLPNDIASIDCKRVDNDFHARYSCKGKEYVYKILNSPVRDPFNEGLCYKYPHKIDVELLDSACKGFMGTHDFSAFCSANAKEGSKVRTVTNARVDREGDYVIFTVSADGFLYNMVRIMVGTLLRINEGKFFPEDIPEIIDSRDRSNAGPTAPAMGLYLNRVIY